MRYFKNKPMFRKVWADFTGNRNRSILVVLSIAIGIFAIGLVVYLQEGLRADLDKNWKEIVYPNIIVNCGRFDDQLVNSVKKVPGVKLAQGLTELRARMKVDGVDRFLSFKMAPRDLSTQKMEKIRVLSGDWPPRADEVFMEAASLKYAKLKVGDTIEVDLWSKKEKFKIAGTVYDSQPGPAMMGSLSVYIGPAAKNLLNLQKPYTQMIIMVNDADSTDTAKIEVIGENVKKRIEQAGKEVRFTQYFSSDEHIAMKFIKGLTNVLAGLGAGALLLSGFLLFNTISALLLQQTRQIGIMKAIGGGSVQIATMYIFLVLMFSCIALLVAVPSSFILAKLLAAYINTQFNVESSGMIIPWKVLFMQLGIGLIIPQLAALHPIWRGTSITAREAMSSYGAEQSESGDKWIDVVTGRFKSLSRPSLLSIRNTFRRKGRLILTVAVMTISGSIFITVMCAYDSMNATVADALKYFNFDASVSFQRSYRQGAIKEALRFIPEIKTAEAWEGGQARLYSLDQDVNDPMKNTRVQAVPPDSKMMEVSLVQGRWLLNQDENAIVFDQAALTAHPNIKIGDTVVMKDDNRKTKWILIGVVKSFFSQPDGAGSAYVPYEYYCKIMGVPKSVRSIMLKVDRKGKVAGEFTKDLEAKMKAAGLQVQRVFTIDQEIESLNTFFLIMLGIFSIMSVLMGFIGALGIAGTMGMNVIERIREIGVMRAIGADNRQIINIFLFEGVLISFISWAFSIVFALLISYPACYFIGKIMFQSPLSYVFSLKGALIWLVCSLAFGALASIAPAKQASKISVRDAIAYE